MTRVLKREHGCRTIPEPKIFDTGVTRSLIGNGLLMVPDGPPYMQISFDFASNTIQPPPAKEN